MVQIIARGKFNVVDIAERVTLSRPTVSNHLNILRRAGLVRVRKPGREMYLLECRALANVPGFLRK